VIERGRWLVLGGSSARQRWSFQLVALGLLAVVSLSVLAVKLAELQVSEGSSLAALARLNSVHRVVLEAERGIIYDRHGVALVQNAPAWNLEVIPAHDPGAYRRTDGAGATVRHPRGRARRLDPER